MPLFVGLLVLLGGMALFLQQNWTPALALVFLGNRSQPLPLAVWVLAAAALGALTTGVLSRLMGYDQDPMATQSGEPSPRRPRYTQDEEDDDYDGDDGDDGDDWLTEEWDNRMAKSSVSRPSASPSAPSSDRVDSHRADRDRTYDSPGAGQRKTTSSPTPDAASSPTAPTRQTDPAATQLQSGQQSGQRTSSQQTSTSGSTYAYGSQSAGKAIGRPEGVYDAEYRVLIPPYTPLSQPTTVPADRTIPDDEPEVWDNPEDDWAASDEEDDDWAES